MGVRGGGQSAQVITAFQSRHDPAAGVPVGEIADQLCHPSKVFLGELQLCQGILAMGIETRGNEDQLGLVPVNGRAPVCLDRFAELKATGTRRQRCVWCSATSRS